MGYHFDQEDRTKRRIGGISVHVQIDAEIATSNVRTQLRSYIWPRAEETLVKFTEYQVGRTLPSRSGPFQARLKNSSGVRPLGELSLVPSELPIVIHQTPGRRRIFVCVYESLYFEEVTGLDRGNGEETLKHFLDLRSPALSTLMQRMQQELINPGFASQLYIESAGNMVLIELARYLKQVRGQHAHSPASSGLAPWQLRRIKQRTEEIMKRGVPSLAELAELCGASQDRVMRGFKASTGMTLHRYVEEKRLSLAKSLLENDQYSIKEIAFRLKFSSQTYFSAAFRKLLAVTPTEYRKMVRAR
jgi:AraC family transcriptional regulator